MVHGREVHGTMAKGAWVRPYPSIAPAGCTVWGHRGKGDGRFGEGSCWSQSISLPPDDWSSEDSEVWTSRIYGTWSREVSTQKSRGDKQPAGAGRRELFTTRKRARSCPCEACPAGGGREDPHTAHRILLRAGGPGEAGRTVFSHSLTFVQGRQFQGDADDSNQVLGGNEGAQDGPDADGFSLPCLDKLQGRVGE